MLFQSFFLFSSYLFPLFQLTFFPPFCFLFLRLSFSAFPVISSCISYLFSLFLLCRCSLYCCSCKCFGPRFIGSRSGSSLIVEFGSGPGSGFLNPELEPGSRTLDPDPDSCFDPIWIRSTVLLFFCFLVVPDRIRTIPYVTGQPSCIRNLLFASGSFNPGSSSFLTPSSESGTRIRIHSYGLGSDFVCVADPDQGLNAHSRFPDPQPIF